MKKKLVISLIIVAVANLSSAQNAKEILDAMSTKYKAIHSFKSNINYTMINKADAINDTYKGSVAVKGDMYIIKMNSQKIINNGTTVWTYLLDDNEVNIDNHNAEAGDITPSSIYNIYKSGFTYILLPSIVIEGKKINVIDLISSDKKNQFYKIRLEIDSKTKDLRKFTMYDSEGSEFSYTISNFNTTVNLKTSDFSFDETQYKGVEIIDLR